MLYVKRTIFVAFALVPVVRSFLQCDRRRKHTILIPHAASITSTATIKSSREIKTSSAVLFSTTDENVDKNTSEKFDFDAVAKYFTAIGIQMAAITLVFRLLDAASARLSFKAPFAVNVLLFYFLALKSRFFNPLANNRPNTKTLEKDHAPKRIMPRWTPPGFVFPIVWLLIIGPIRAVTSAMIYESVGSYTCLPILSLMLHLSIGDVWNTINNVERRYGTSVLGVVCVWLSKAHAAYRYAQVNALAGNILGVSLIWLTIATALVAKTWRLNPDPETGKMDPLYPVTGKAKTNFAWRSIQDNK
jgi:tryptophan-rich sensory protein